MEMYWLFHLFLFFIVRHPTATSFSICRKRKTESIQIVHNFSQNGFWVEVYNLMEGVVYEFAIVDCDTGYNNCQENLRPNASTIRFFRDNSCLSCGNDEAISIRKLIGSSGVHHRIVKQGCVSTTSSTSEDLISSTIPSTRKDFVSLAMPSTRRDSVSPTVPSTRKESISSTIPSTRKKLVSPTIPSLSKVAITSFVSVILLISLPISACFVWRVYKRRKKKFYPIPNSGKPESSNVQGLVICCPCSEVHRQATKELLSLINNFTDLHATSYLDLKLCEEEAIPTLIQQQWERVSWIIVIESANFYHHSKEQDLEASDLCNLMASLSVQLLKHSTKVEHKHLKTIYRISFDLGLKEFELSQVFPELNGHIYSLLMQSANLVFCLNFDEIERFFEDLTYKQLGKSIKNIRRWTNNNWKESSEAKNLEKALVNRIDEMWNSSGCYSIDERYFSAEQSFGNSQLKRTHCFPGNLYVNDQLGNFQDFNKTNEKDCDSIGTFQDHSSFENFYSSSNNQSLIHPLYYLNNPKIKSSDNNSDVSSNLRQINVETDARINNNLMKMIEDRFDRLDEASV